MAQIVWQLTLFQSKLAVCSMLATFTYGVSPLELANIGDVKVISQFFFFKGHETMISTVPCIIHINVTNECSKRYGL